MDQFERLKEIKEQIEVLEHEKWNAEGNQHSLQSLIYTCESDIRKLQNEAKEIMKELHLISNDY